MNGDDSVRASSSSAEDIPFSTALELGRLTVEMVGGAQHQVDIASRSLAPAVYNTQELLDAVKKLVLSGRGRVRILVLDPASVISQGNHRLVDLAMRLSSYMEIRRPGPDHAEFNEAMLIVDGLGIIHRKFADRYEGIANFGAPRKAALLTESFEALWQNAETVPYFRRLML